MSRLQGMNRRCWQRMGFNWRTGITGITIITEAVQLAITFQCIIILKCLKSVLDDKKRELVKQFPLRSNSQTINELKAFYFTIIIYALVIFIFGIMCSVLLVSGAKKHQSKSLLSWLIYQGLFLASSFVVAYILIKVRDEERYGHRAMEYKTFYDLSAGIYWVTFVTFLPALLYFWKRVLCLYMQIVKGEIAPDGSGDYDENQSVAFIADTFDKGVTLDMQQ